MRLFDEAEVLAVDAEEGTEETPAQTVAAAHARKAWGCCKPLPASLPRTDIVHELPKADRVCPHDVRAGQNHRSKVIVRRRSFRAAQKLRNPHR